MTRPPHTLLSLFVGFFLISAAGAAQPTSRTAATQQKFKAIFEAVNYPQDLELHDVVFVNDSVGWAAGAAGTILFTRDHGKTWTAQLGGDPKGADRPIVDLRFVKDKVGFAVQSKASGDHRLYRTMDGETWTESGTVGQHRGDYQFTSAENGVYLHGEDIYHTKDGGKTWTNAYKCQVNVTVQGLSRNSSCHFESVSFATPQIGYAVSRDVGTTAFVVAKTTNGGAEWTTSTIPEPNVSAEYVVFLDENNGFVRMWGGKIYATRDGGKTWTGVAGAVLEGGKAAKLRFVDGRLGWGVSPYGTFIHTSDGGKRWMTRQIKFPATINAFTLPSKTAGYVVGEHGMVYRYRIVPIAYKGANVIEAPAMQ